MVFSLKEVAFGESELLEHRVIGAGLQFALGVADHRSQIAQRQKTVRAFAARPNMRYAAWSRGARSHMFAAPDIRQQDGAPVSARLSGQLSCATISMANPVRLLNLSNLPVLVI